MDLPYFSLLGTLSLQYR